MKLQHLEGDTNTQMSMIDAKTKQLIDELRASLHSTHSSAEVEREKTEQRLLAAIEKSEANHDLTVV